MDIQPTSFIDMPKAYEIYMGLENMDITTPATESAISNVTCRSLMSIIDQINTNYTRWYSHQQAELRKLSLMVHSVNKDKLTQLSTELKQLVQNKKALKKKVRERNLPKEEQDAARRELEATIDQIRRIDDEYENLLSVIQVPAHIATYYGNATQAYGKYMSIIDQEINIYDKFLTNPIWEREPPIKIRDGANVMLDKILGMGTAQIRRVADDIQMALHSIINSRVNVGDKMVTYPIKSFTSLYTLLADTRRKLNPLIYSLTSIRNEIRSRNYGDNGNQYDNERYAAQVRAVSVIINDATDYWKFRCSVEVALIEKCELPIKK